jgi:gamma-glutamyltranspeptidase / glutathione hydrolase
MKITTAAPPSAGGTVLLETLNILEGYDLAEQTPVNHKHLIVEALRRSYKDRAEYMGDPDFVAIPSHLRDKQYANQLRTTIDRQRATPSAALGSQLVPAKEGGHTTHLSILDADGNRVAATLTINYPFGAGFIPPGTGVVLNDEMDDFAAAPGTPNVYGLVGGEANSIAPGKRPLSSMTPSFLETPEQLAIVGTPGGSRISSMVILATLAFAEGRDAKAMVGLPRYHHQYLPDQIQFEPAGLNDLEQAGLRRKGHVLKRLEEPYGNMQVLVWDKRSGAIEAASDPREEGKAYVLHGN